ncbi:MAG TPA: YceI family protein [Polyangia bacterium]|jgi:polyisoprenoid-binding protein YceI|nr:YceI family protein [Polyangia bacterium]
MKIDATETAIPGGSWIVDPAPSSVHFAVTHNTVGSFRSGFREFSARLEGGATPSLEGEAEVDSLVLGQGALRGHLLSPDFFDALFHHEISFGSDRIALCDRALEVDGRLRINDSCRRVRARGSFDRLESDRNGLERLGIALGATIDRRDFGMRFNATLANGKLVLDWQVEISVVLEMVREDLPGATAP